MRESTLWLLQISTGMAILVLLGLHMGVMHLDDLLVALGMGYADPLSHASVAERARQAFYLVVYLLLLGCGLYHGLYGMRTIIAEAGPGPRVMRWVTGAIVAVGVLFFVYGAYAIIGGFAMRDQV